MLGVEFQVPSSNLPNLNFNFQLPEVGSWRVSLRTFGFALTPNPFPGRETFAAFSPLVRGFASPRSPPWGLRLLRLCLFASLQLPGPYSRVCGFRGFLFPILRQPILPDPILGSAVLASFLCLFS